MKKMGIAILLIILSLNSAKADELVLGYITHIPQESRQAREKRHKIVAERRAGIPLMVHRGAAKEAPENTLEAYAAAMDIGADGVEIDVRRSRDGVLYLFHDETLDRETNGSGKVRNVTYYDLLKLTPKRIYGRANKDTRPPTLAAFLVLARRRNVLLHLDIKESGIQYELADMLEKMDMWDHIVEVNAGNADGLRPPDDPNNSDPNAPYNKVRLIPYKGWIPTWDGPNEEVIKAIKKWLPTKPGMQMVFCKDPRLPAKAMGKIPHKTRTISKNLRAWWGPEGIIKKFRKVGINGRRRTFIIVSALRSAPLLLNPGCIAGSRLRTSSNSTLDATGTDNLDSPNVQLIMTDQYRFDLMTCAGNELLLTLGIDRIAASGVGSTRPYCP